MTARLDDATRRDWLRLLRSENIGPRTFRALVNHYGGARAALAALPGLVRRRGGGARIASEADADRELAAAARFGVRFLALGEPDYPPRLRELDDSPPLIAVRGRTEVLTRPMVAIVGARNASAAGLKMAGMLARGLGDAGFVIVSGLARGIDGSAHTASLTAGTVAVLAGGHDRIYPPEHGPLLDQIVATGAAVSEMPMGWEPRGRDFPRRNRLISGMALGVVVVEAAVRSGSLYTARRAAEQGREVFAVPGSPLDPRAAGSNGLLKQGATLVTEVADVVDVLRPIMGQRPPRPDLGEPPAPIEPSPPPDDTLRGRLLELLGPTPVSVDDLVRLTRAPAAAVRVVLFELEFDGRLERHAGGLVALAV